MPPAIVRIAAASTATNTAVDAPWIATGECSPRPERAITPFATAPKIATPTALPIERRNMLAPVTTPRSDHGTDDCAAMSVGEATSPRPRPTMKHAMAVVQTFGVSEAATSAAEPSTETASPMSAVRRNPMRRKSRPAWLAEIGQPSVSAATASPDTSGVAPAVDSRNVGTYEVSPMSTAPTPSEMSEVVTMRRRENTQSGSTGSAARRSMNTKATSSRAPTANAPIDCQESHSHAWPPSSTARISRVDAIVSTLAPAKSMRCFSRVTDSW